MSKILIYSVLAASVSGALGGALTASLLNGADKKVPSKPSKDVSRVEARAAEPTPDETLRRLTDVERQVASLRTIQQRLMLERQAAEDDDPNHDTPPLDVADPVFEAAVMDIIGRSSEKRRMERQEQRRQRRSQSITDSVGKLAQSVNLNPAQVNQLTEIMERHWDRLHELRETPPQGDRAERREQLAELAQAAEENIRKVLDSRQLAEYDGLPPDAKLDVGRRRERNNQERRPSQRSQTP